MYVHTPLVNMQLGNFAGGYIHYDNYVFIHTAKPIADEKRNVSMYFSAFCPHCRVLFYTVQYAHRMNGRMRKESYVLHKRAEFILLSVDSTEVNWTRKVSRFMILGRTRKPDVACFRLRYGLYVWYIMYIVQ